MSAQVLVIIGTGGMGEAIAKRSGAGKTVLLADLKQETLDRLQKDLSGNGFNIITQTVDVSSRESVKALAERAAKSGLVTEVVHTAGLSPVQAPVSAILRVDLLGVALVLEEFGKVIAPGGAGVVIASMAGHNPTGLTLEQEKLLMTTSADDLLDLSFLRKESLTAPAVAYVISKRANILRVAAQSLIWGKRGARVNTISPGVISTPMGQQELAGENGAAMRALTMASGSGRFGTPYDIANAVAFLIGPDSSFITGIDLLVDGGVTAVMK